MPARARYPRRLTVADLMTRNVVTVRRDTPFKDVDRLLQFHAISAVPVVEDDGTVVGVVSEADLLLRQAGGRAPRPWFAVHGRASAAAKAGGLVAGELMTSPPITIRSTASLAQAARMLDDRRVKRLPVVEDGERLAGIISRRDVLKAYLRDDVSLEEEVIHGVLRRWRWSGPSHVTAHVADGVVTLTGSVADRADLDIVSRLISGLDGVVAVHGDAVATPAGDAVRA